MLDVGVSAFFHACTVGGIILVFPISSIALFFGSARVEFVNEVGVGSFLQAEDSFCRTSEA